MRKQELHDYCRMQNNHVPQVQQLERFHPTIENYVVNGTSIFSLKFRYFTSIFRLCGHFDFLGDHGPGNTTKKSKLIRLCLLGFFDFLIFFCEATCS
jgi:hypothetical protein